MTREVSPKLQRQGGYSNDDGHKDEEMTTSRNLKMNLGVEILSTQTRRFAGIFLASSDNSHT